MSETNFKRYKFRIYPSKAQIRIFEFTLDLCRELYNAALQERRDAWKLNGIKISRFDQEKQLPQIKETNVEYKSTHSQILTSTLRRLDITFKSFFRRIQKAEKPGYPRFKSKNNYNSFIFPQNIRGAFGIRKGKLHLSKIGKVKIKLHREIEGKVKNCCISKDRTGKWFVSFACEIEKEKLEPVNKNVGLDVGLTHFATLSTGEQIANPRFFKTDEKELAKAQRKLSKEKKGSKERFKRRKVVARIYERIRNRRNNFAHQISRKLVNNYDKIFFENLNIRGLIRNSRLSKAIADAAWNQTIEFTRYKAENAGRLCALVNPKNTSQNCSNCGEKVEKDLSVRTHNCTGCGFRADRDLNAAINILTLGLQSLVKT